MKKLLYALAVSLASIAQAEPAFVFDSIDGGQIDLHAFRGNPVLVVNTASRCGFTPQYDGLQALYERYREQGLVVLAVPSNDFRQELSSDEKVAEFCEVNFDLTLPMTTITPVTGDGAHPFYRWLKADHGYAPRWNFSKVLIGPDGDYVAAFKSRTSPLSSRITRSIDTVLAGG